MSRETQAAIPLSLYLHFPWCVQKCPYCDFNSHPQRGALPEDAYVDALLRDLDFELSDRSETRPLIAIFMGGGTPSLFSDRSIGRLLEQVNRRLTFADDIEITLEANPGTAEAGNFRGYRDAGVNRLSMGIQSLDDRQLQRLGRIHSAAEAMRAYARARAAGFDNINLDLMYALPQQDLAAALADLDGGIALQPEHLSWYQLTLEPNTEFGLRPPPVPDEDTAWAMQLEGQQRLAAAGYAQYEVSAYARDGRQSRHNRNYWEYGDYLGIGAGAHAKRSDAGGVAAVACGESGDATGFRITRAARHKHPRRYLRDAGTAGAIQERIAVAPAERPFEFLMNALRLNDGFTPALYAERTGLHWSADTEAVRRAIQRGLLDVGARRIRPTEFGRRHLNGLLRLFLDT
ncbi:radical SAM family heme chaperone HemW [Sinimarinibacterium thermocellulolyticum]|uniref:Heme chaperone HemW n=1 Tax=Sinimarinibacterium thermocellulolyticum TaxID=3170016 RepID=A0ABV2AEA7_9GAMM